MWGWFVESISIPLANHPKDLADNFFLDLQLKQLMSVISTRVSSDLSRF